jgi:hypothetical protein
MRFPKRTPEHVTETVGWRILQDKAPGEWVIRELTERDYGIDAYIEIASVEGEMTGKLCLLQLKSTSRIGWVGGKATMPGIPISTVNYWLRLPVPVFLIWADVEAHRVFYRSVKEFARYQYDKLVGEGVKSLGFSFSDGYELGVPAGNLVFEALYEIESQHDHTENYLTDLLIHCQEYFSLLVQNQGRDFFMTAGPEDQIKLIHLYRCCRAACGCLNIEWHVSELEEVVAKEREWNLDSGFRECPMTLFLREMQAVLAEVVEKGKHMVTVEQSAYWHDTNPALLYYCRSLDTSGIRARAPAEG